MAPKLRMDVGILNLKHNDKPRPESDAGRPKDLERFVRAWSEQARQETQNLCRRYLEGGWRDTGFSELQVLGRG
jgi:hypothetical protein